MALHCPACSVPVTAPMVNISVNSGKCGSCRMEFKITDAFEGKVDIDYANPPATKRVAIDFLDSGAMKLTFKPGGLPGGSWFAVIFALFWNGVLGAIVLAILSSPQKFELENLMLLPFLLIGFAVAFWAAYSIWGFSEAVIEQKGFTITYHLFFWSRRRHVALQDIRGVEISEAYQENYQPVNSCALVSTRNKKFRFALRFPDREQQWLCNVTNLAIKKFRQQVSGKA